MEKPLEYMACQGNSIRLFGTLWDLIYMTFLMKAYVIENFRCPAEEWSYVYCQNLGALNWWRTGDRCLDCMLMVKFSQMYSQIV